MFGVPKTGELFVPSVCFAGTPATLDYHQRRGVLKQSMPNTICFESVLITMLRAPLCYSYCFVMKYFLNLLRLNNAGCICNSSTSSTGQSKVVIMPIFTFSLYPLNPAHTSIQGVAIVVAACHLLRSLRARSLHPPPRSKISPFWSFPVICFDLWVPTKPTVKEIPILVISSHPFRSLRAILHHRRRSRDFGRFQSSILILGCPSSTTVEDLVILVVSSLPF
jgi:hypothetical protein